MRTVRSTSCSSPTATPCAASLEKPPQTVSAEEGLSVIAPVVSVSKNYERQPEPFGKFAAFLTRESAKA